MISSDNILAFLALTPVVLHSAIAIPSGVTALLRACKPVVVAARDLRRAFTHCDTEHANPEYEITVEAGDPDQAETRDGDVRCSGQ